MNVHVDSRYPPMLLQTRHISPASQGLCVPQFSTFRTFVMSVAKEYVQARSTPHANPMLYPH